MGCGSSSSFVSGGSGTGREPVVSDDEHRRRNVVLNEIEHSGKTLKLTDADLLLGKNRKEHNTDQYEQDYLILRRGHKFQFSITFDRKIDTQNDIVIIQFTCGSRPQESKRSIIRIPLNAEGDGQSSDASNTWTCSSKITDSTQVTFDIVSPPDCTIGDYKLFIETRLKEDEKELSRSEIKNWRIVFIFNPWCKDDAVYMEDSGKQKEYVLNEHGRIYTGTEDSIRSKPWNFGQFQFPCLDVALYLLDQKKMNEVGKASVISVTRAISSRANSMDNDGILQGNWSGDYAGGTKPTAWAGSVKILDQYFRTKTCVKYGQCWVFSGIVTTLCRAMGIPTRSITNFDSAHDTDYSMTIDTIYDSENNRMENGDSVWNFHVWNEAWFRRKDLPEGYDGWQAFDATPQESSFGVYRCGPSPLKAIKEGQVYINYDTRFIFAEVNGDRIKWATKEDGSYEILEIDKGAVGHNISTKAVGSNDREDVTHFYKYKDGSEDEKRVTEFAKRFSSRKEDLKIKPPETEVSITYPIDTLALHDFEVKISLKNLTDEDASISGTVTISNCYYHGTSGKIIKEEKIEKQIGSKKDAELVVKILVNDYIKNKTEDGQFKIYVIGVNKSTGRKFAKQGSFQLKVPELTIEVPKEIVVNTDTKAIVRFKNPFPVTLTHVQINYEGPMKSDVKSLKDLNPGDEIEEIIVMHPKTAPTVKYLTVSLSSDQISGIDAGELVWVVG